MRGSCQEGERRRRGGVRRAMTGGLALTTAARARAHTHAITTLSCDDDLIKAGHGEKKNPSKQRSRRGLSRASRRSGTSGLLRIRSLQRLFLIKTEEAVREVV